MNYVIAISGPVAVGKSMLADEVVRRFDVERISTSRILKDLGTPDERQKLIDAGKKLDVETDGRWVADGVQKMLSGIKRAPQVFLIDAVRTEQQVKHLREKFGSRFLHFHVVAPVAVCAERYAKRAKTADAAMEYEAIRRDSTEAGVWQLDKVADRVVENVNKEAPSLLAEAVAGLGLFPLYPAPNVDVIVGGQYGSEGKGNICNHIADEYGILMRVGGPNAGHKVAYPKAYTFIQLPSGTMLRAPGAKILIGAGATIAPEVILREIAELNLTEKDVIIDEQAMVIEASDVEFECGTEDVIGSTRRGVGAATARKILGRFWEDGTHKLGARVRLAKDHPQLQKYVGQTQRHLEDAYAAGVKIMLEGTQGTALSLHHGSYPHVTSRETTVSGCLADAGIAPHRIRKVVMVTRCYPIRVGGASGPMGIEINAKTIADRSGLPLEEIAGKEVGSVSGKPRRFAEFDWELLRRSAMLNGATDIALTFADYISVQNKMAPRYDSLTQQTRDFIDRVEAVANAPVSLITTCFDRFGLIDRRNWR